MGQTVSTLVLEDEIRQCLHELLRPTESMTLQRLVSSPQIWHRTLSSDLADAQRKMETVLVVGTPDQRTVREFLSNSAPTHRTHDSTTSSQRPSR